MSLLTVLLGSVSRKISKALGVSCVSFLVRIKGTTF